MLVYKYIFSFQITEEDFNKNFLEESWVYWQLLVSFVDYLFCKYDFNLSKHCVPFFDNESHSSNQGYVRAKFVSPEFIVWF